jgi:hypothetical protein
MANFGRRALSQQGLFSLLTTPCASDALSGSSAPKRGGDSYSSRFFAQQYAPKRRLIERGFASGRRQRRQSIPTTRYALTAPGLISQAVALDAFPTLVRQSFGHPTEASTKQDLDNAVADIRGLMHEADHRSGLTDADIVMLVVLAGMIADGFDHVDQGGGLGHLYQIRRHSAVFIDEVQDFTEIEILVMGMTATSTYHQITLSGDRSQRLQSSGAEVYDDLFPWVPRSHQNKSIFLDFKFRQRQELAALSSGFRFFIQNDGSVDFQAEKAPAPQRSTNTGPMSAWLISFSDRSVRCLSTLRLR